MQYAQFGSVAWHALVSLLTWYILFCIYSVVYSSASKYYDNKGRRFGIFALSMAICIMICVALGYLRFMYYGEYSADPDENDPSEICLRFSKMRENGQ
jgi:Na+/proline symporter